MLTVRAAVWRKGRCGDAAEIALTLLAEVGVRYPSMSVAGKGCDVKVILDVCRDAGGLLASIAGDDGLPEDFRHEVDAEMRALAGKYPFLTHSRLSARKVLLACCQLAVGV